MKNDEVLAEIDRLRGERDKLAVVDAAYVLTRLRENVERAMTVEPVLNSEGEETGVYRYDGAVANKALELLGKHLGMFKDKVEVSGGLTQTHIYLPRKQPTDGDADTASG